MIDDYLYDIGKIVEGAANSDLEKVYAYGELLEQKLATAGKKTAAKRISQILGKSKASQYKAARANPAHTLPVDSESQTTLADEERVSVGDVKLFLPTATADVVDRFLAFFRAADRLAANGVGVSPSMLIYGPPGCGKTLLARHIAGHLKLPLLVARADGLISSYLGSTAKNLRSLFEYAMSRPCVLFLDEFDAIAKMRDDEHELGELKRVVISLLQNIDAMGRDHVLLAATNHEHLLDPAIWRRFSYKVKVEPPVGAARTEIAKLFLGQYASNDVVQALAALTAGLSGAQIRDIAEDAVRDAVINDHKQIDIPSLISRTWAVAHPDMKSPELGAQLLALQNTNKKLFTQERLATMFDKAQSTICELIKKAKRNAA